VAITYTGERDIVVGVSGAFNLVFTNVVPSSGDLLVLTIGTGSGSAFTQSWSAVTGAGWTLAASSNPANESQETHAAIFYKISDGTETGINVDIGSNSPVVTATRWTGNATSSVLDATGYDNGEANAPTGTDAYSGAASSTADGAAIALVVWKDQRFAEDGTNSASNSFTIIQDIDPANHGGSTNNANPVIAWLAYTGSASRSTTITTTDTGDENAGVIALFKAAGGGATISGALSVSLADVTVSASGALSIAGSAGNTLAAVGLSGAGALAIDGALTQTLGDLQISSDGTAGFAGITGSLSVALGDASLAASGALLVTGSLAVAIGLSTLAGSGALSIAGASSVTLGDVGAISEGFIGAAPITGSLAQTLDALVAASAGQIGISASAAIQIGDAALSSGGAVLVTGTLAQQLGDLVVAAAASIAVDGSAGITLGVLDLSSSGGPLADITASAAITLDAVAANGSAGVLITGALEELLGEVGISSLGGDIFYIITLDGEIVAFNALNGRIVARRISRKIVAAKTLN
jgi:fibronectin-binding autotransporter adhesin